MKDFIVALVIVVILAIIKVLGIVIGKLPFAVLSPIIISVIVITLVVVIHKKKNK